MPVKLQSLNLPVTHNPEVSRGFVQISNWSRNVKTIIDSLGSDPGHEVPTTAGSAVTTLSFTGDNGSIAIKSGMHFVTGGTSLATIQPPIGFTGVFYLIPTDQFAIVSGGNIHITATILTAAFQTIPMIFDGAMWYIVLAPQSGIRVKVKEITDADSPYTVGSDDYFLLISANGGDVDVLLPAAVGPDATGSGRTLVMKRLDANEGTYNVNIAPAGTDTIDGATTFSIAVQNLAYNFADYATGKWATW